MIKGSKQSAEAKRKMSEKAKLRVGALNPFFGKTHSATSKLLISESRKGKGKGKGKGIDNAMSNPIFRDIVRQKMVGRKILWGDKISYTRKLKIDSGQITVWNKGKRLSETHRKNLSASRIQKGVARLEKNPRWRGGLSFQPYPLGWERNLRESIRTQFGHRCAVCKNPEIAVDIRTGRTRILGIHHINYNKADLRRENLIPLCAHCHAKTNSNRVYWEAFFKTLR